MESTKPENVFGAVSEERSLAFLSDVELELRAVFGRKSVNIGELLKLKRGSVIVLDRELDAGIDLYLNGNMIGSGEVVVVNDNYGVRVTAIKDPNL